jgi:septal ring factor EnvC (AmiA/AmiB activator)
VLITEIAALLAAVGVGGVITAIVNGVFNRKPRDADVESKTVQNALALVEPYRNQVSDVRRETQEHLNELRQQVADLRERNIEITAELKATREQLGQLTRRERELIGRQAQMSTYLELLRNQAHEAGVDVLPVPEPLAPRREYTRASDGPIVEDANPGRAHG